MQQKTMPRVSKSIAVIITLAMLFLSFAGCSSKGKTLMKIDKTSLSVNMFELFLSRMKGTLCSSYYYGSEALQDSFWDKLISSDGTTYNSFYTAKILNDTKTYLAALCLFDELDLKLPSSYTDEIDEKLNQMIEDDAEGSKNTFNSILAQYGANYKILREAYIIEAKIAYLREYLYGANGSAVGDELKEEYYQNNYARFKQVFFYTYGVVYKTDADGKDIYYKPDTSYNIIAYDTTKTQKKNGNDVVRDENEDIIYVGDDGKIAYDEKNGERAPLYDEDGNVVTRNYTTEELIQVSDRAQLVYEQMVKGDFTLFNSFADDTNLNEDQGLEKYTNGYYVTKDSDYDSPEVIKALFEMEVGEIRIVHSEYGIHVVMRYELDEGGYADSANSDFFVSTKNGSYVFMSDLITWLLEEKLKPYSDRITVDTALLASADMKSVGANFYY